MTKEAKTFGKKGMPFSLTTESKSSLYCPIQICLVLTELIKYKEEAEIAQREKRVGAT